MTEKVKVTKEIANAIELAKDKHGDYLLHEVLRKLELNSKFRDELAPLNKLLNTQRVLAVTVGYEVETTPEDIIRNRWNSISDSSEVAKKLNDKESLYRCNGIKDGIEITLNALNIKIKGIND